jgi:hypothetical protein
VVDLRYRIVGSESPVAVFAIVNGDAIEVCGCCGRSSSNLPDAHSLGGAWISFIAIRGDVGVMVVTSKKVWCLDLGSCFVLNLMAFKGDCNSFRS